MIDPVIYVIFNIINDKCYVGQAVAKHKRWKDHRLMLKTDSHKNRHLQSSYNKYGVDAFIYIVVENLLSSSELNDREQYWIDKLKPEYNKAPVAGSCLGFKHSDETRALLSKIRKGKPRSEKAKLAIKEGWKKRKPVSEETKNKLRVAHIGKKHSDETKAKMSMSKIGNTINNGRKQSIEVIEHRASFHRGKTVSVETRAKMSIAQKGRMLTEEHKQKLRKPKRKNSLDEILKISK